MPYGSRIGVGDYVMKAQNLEMVLNNFVLPGTLEGQLLRQWFVDRDKGSRNRLALDLKSRRGSFKVLYLGHRGAGKSTELNQLKTEIDDAFYVFGFNAMDLIGRTNLEYEDLMLTILAQVTSTCIKEEFITKPLAQPLKDQLQRLGDWWKKFVAGRGFTAETAEASVSVQLDSIVGQVELALKLSATSRDEFKFQVSQQLPEILRQLDLTVTEAEKAIGKSLLLVVEGTDKIDLEAAKTLFEGRASTLTAPKLNIVYTAPISLQTSGVLNNLQVNFPTMEYLPNIAAWKKDGKSDRKGIEVLENLILNRVEATIIEKNALKLLAQNNGGIPATLVGLVRRAALYALTDGNEKTITKADVHKAIVEYRNEILVPSLTQADWDILRKRHQDKDLSADSENQRLLHNGTLIEYRNGNPWCDVHPALWDLLEEPPEDED